MRKISVIASGILVMSLALAWWMSLRTPQPVVLIPSLTNQPEYCLSCHANLPEISPSHPVKVFGCVICHGGERLSLDADLAHSTMRGGANPSDLTVVEAGCGGSNCHSGSEADNRNHIQRVMTSIQSTYAGAIANIRYTFGAQTDLTARLGIRNVADETTRTGITTLSAFNPSVETNPIIQKFGENCLTCHINSAPRKDPQFARWTGCAACHSPASLPLTSNTDEIGQSHQLTLAIPFSQCNTCHNRGNYDLRTMTFTERTDPASDRLHEYYQPIAQFTRCEYTLDCVDCHTRTEAMGDGDIHSNQKDIQYVQCKSCHGTPTELPLTKTLTDPNELAFRFSTLNPVVNLKLGDTILVTEQGEAFWNTRVLSDGTFEMIGKITKQHFSIRPVLGSHCTQSGDDQSSAYCHKCHAVKRN